MEIVNPSVQQLPDLVACRIIRALTGCRFDLTDEKRLQEQISQRFDHCGIAYEQEAHLSSKDIADFFVDGLAIECKLIGQPKRGIYRQLARYAVHDSVTGILLVTNVSMGLPEDIDGKPAYFFSLGKGWL